MKKFLTLLAVVLTLSFVSRAQITSSPSTNQQIVKGKDQRNSYRRQHQDN